MELDEYFLIVCLIHQLFIMLLRFVELQGDLQTFYKIDYFLGDYFTGLLPGLLTDCLAGFLSCSPSDYLSVWLAICLTICLSGCKSIINGTLFSLRPIYWFQFADDAAVTSGQESETQQALLNRFKLWCQ